LGAACAGLVMAEPVAVRVVAANLTSGTHQSYSPDNGNHSNPEGAGARILKGLNPDIVLIQEFNTSVSVRQWVNATFGREFFFFREEGEGIPNGIVSRFPIVESGEWSDPALDNRDFAWARIALPNGRILWAISVHFYSRKESGRIAEAREIAARVAEQIPAEDLVVFGGDLNTRTVNEECLAILGAKTFVTSPRPQDAAGNDNTNANRNKPYDWVLADADLDATKVPVRIGTAEFPGGLVLDTRIFTPLADTPPAQKGDSAAPQMQHMAVARDFLIPDAEQTPVGGASPAR